MDGIFNSKKVAVITLLGTLAFVSNGFLPSPIDKMVIGIQALCFSLAALLVAKGGAVYASLVTGLLLSVLRTSFFPFSLLFSLFYGLIITDNHVSNKSLIMVMIFITYMHALAIMHGLSVNTARY